jgi:uncharacterized protein YdgA (DUF945 family)
MPRLNTTLQDADVENLEEIKTATKLDQNDAIRKAIATEAFVQRNLKQGARLLLELEDGTIKQIEFVR